MLYSQLEDQQVAPLIIFSQFSRSRQLGGRMPAFRLGFPPRYKANKL